MICYNSFEVDMMNYTKSELIRKVLDGELTIENLVDEIVRLNTKVDRILVDSKKLKSDIQSLERDIEPKIHYVYEECDCEINLIINRKINKIFRGVFKTLPRVGESVELKVPTGQVINIRVTNITHKVILSEEKLVQGYLIDAEA